MAVYKKGSTGEFVKQIQNALGLKADGIFGRATETAVKNFQKENGLYADGIVGKKTLEKLIPDMDTDLTNIVKPVKLLEIKDYFLPKKEYLNGKYKNEYIVLHHTAGWDKPYQVVDYWTNDANGKVATEFVIGGQRCTDGRSTYDGQIVRSYPEGNQAYHIGKCGSDYMKSHSVGIEICNMGYVKNGRTYTGSLVKPEQIVSISEPFRGYTNWHRYTDSQLNSLHDLLLYIANRDNIDLHTGIYRWIKNDGAHNAFEFQQLAYEGKIKGMITHANIRKDKFDVFPQQELIDMILTL